MDTRTYLAPFLTSHSLHMVIGGFGSGKTTYVLQMLATQHTEDNAFSPWSQFFRGEMPNHIWYVDLLRPRHDTLLKVRHMGLAQPDPQTRRLHILNYEQIQAIRPEGNRKDPIMFPDVLQRVMVENDAQIPPILIIDGFGLLLSPISMPTHLARYERDKLAEIDELYLSRGGCLVGLQPFSKNGRVVGVESQGAYTTTGFIGSITEITQDKRQRRRVKITGSNFSPRQMLLEFNLDGRLQIANDLDPTAGIQTIRTGNAYSRIFHFALEMSLMHPEIRFKRDHLVENADKLEVSRATIDRWLKRGREDGTIAAEGERGWFTLVPKPEPPTVQ